VMARDLAAIHLGAADAAKAIEKDLGNRKAGWLTDAVERAAAFVRGEQKEWKKAARKAA
jgi:hypothetical protein